MLTISNHRHYHWLAVTTGLLLVLSFPHQDAHAATLPSVVTSGYTVSVDDVVESGGTTLDVPAMLLNSSSASNTTAIFNVSGLGFEGTLTIACPNVSTGWTTADLQVHIVDGKTATFDSISNPHLVVTGVLSHGSSISIDGGNYTYRSDFITLGRDFGIQRGSSLLVLNTIQHILPTTGASNLIHFSQIALLTIHSNGAIYVTANTVITQAYWNVMHVKVYEESYTILLGIDVSNMSRVSIVDNLVIHNGNMSGGVAVLIIDDFGVLNVDDNSVICITNNSMTADNVILSGSWLVYFINTGSRSVPSVSTSSAISITGNTVSANNSVIAGECTVYFIVTSSIIFASSGSAFVIVGNAVAFSDVKMGGLDVALIYSVGDQLFISHSMKVSDQSALSLLSNTVTVSNATMSGSFRLVLFDIENSNVLGSVDSDYVSISVGSTVSLRNNILTLVDVVGDDFNSWFCTFEYPLLLTSMSNISVVGNTVSLSNLVVLGVLVHKFLFHIAVDTKLKPPIISENSAIYITSNMVTVNNLTAANECYVDFLVVIDNALTISDNSAVFVVDNDIMLNRMSSRKYMGVELYSLRLTSPLTITTSSNVTVSGNIMSATRVSFEYTLTSYFCVVHTATVSENSTLSITNNAMLAKDVTVSGMDWSLLFVWGTLAIHGNQNKNTGSAMNVSNNNMTANNVSVGGDNWKWQGMVLGSSDWGGWMQVYVFSSATCAQNRMEANDATTLNGNLEWYWLYAGQSKEALLLNFFSLLTISDNDMVAHNVSVSDLGASSPTLWRVLYTQSAVGFNGGSANLSITNNTMAYNGSNTPNMRVVDVQSCDLSGALSLLSVIGNVIPQGTVMTIPTLKGKGVVDAKYNVVYGAGSVFDIDKIYSAGVAIRTCLNHVNTTLCDVQNTQYTCSTGGLDGRVRDCEHTATTAASTTATIPATSSITVTATLSKTFTTTKSASTTATVSASTTAMASASTTAIFSASLTTTVSASTTTSIPASTTTSIPASTTKTPTTSISASVPVTTTISSSFTASTSAIQHSPSRPSIKMGLIVGVSVAASVVVIIIGIVWKVRRGITNNGGGNDDGYHSNDMNMPLQDIS